MSETRSIVGVLVVVGVWMAGAGGGLSPGRAGTVPDAATSSPTARAGTLVGVVRLSGEVPEAQAIQMSADPFCLSAHEGEKVEAQQVVVGPDKGLRWAFVRVIGGLEGQSFSPAAAPVVLDQEGCMYAPHVVGIQTGQTLEIVNSDTTLHNVHVFAEANPGFNIAQPIQGMSNERTFDNPEVMISVKCDVHPWMQSWIGVVDHPFFAVTGEDGGFRIDGLPPGDYEVEAWHETLGTVTGKITVRAGAEAILELGLGG